MNASENPIETAEENPTKSRKRDKKSLLVFFSFIAVLVVLVALNMK